MDGRMDRKRKRENSNRQHLLTATISLYFSPYPHSLPCSLFLLSIKHILDIDIKGGLYEMDAANITNDHLTPQMNTADHHK